MRKLTLMIFPFFTIACDYSRALDKHELIVPPVIQEENPEIYKIFKPKEDSKVKKKNF